MGRGAGLAIAGAVLAAGAPVWAPPALAQRQAARVDARAETVATLYAASATQDASERFADATLEQARSEIETLRGQGTRARAALVAAQARYLDALGDRDGFYGQRIGLLYEALQCISATAEGAAALARFNSGDEQGALAALDQAIAARSQGRERTSSEAAGERRCAAALALEAHARRRLDANAVIARYEQVTRLDPGVFWDWLQLAELYRAQGRLPYARRAAERAAILAGEEAYARASLALELGAVLSAQGDLAGARRRYEEALAVARWLTTEHQAGSERTIAVIFARLGDALYAQGDFTGARARYEEADAIAQRFAEAKPGSRVLQRELLLAGLDVGRARAAQGEWDAAGASYEESLALARRLSESDPASVELKKHIADILDHLGEVQLGEGDLISAAARYTERLALVRSLAQAGGGVDAERAVLACVMRLGDVFAAQGDLSRARTRYEEALAIARRLGERNPSVQRDVVASLIKLGDVLMGARDYSASRPRLEEGMALARRLFAQEPNSKAAEQNLAVAQFHLGELDLALSHPEQAHARLTQAVSALRGLSQRHPADESLRWALLGAEFRLAQSAQDRRALTFAIVQLRRLKRPHTRAPLGPRWIGELEILARAEEPD